MRTPTQCARVIVSKRQQCENEAVIHYRVKDDFRGFWITYSLCRKHSPNVPIEQKKRLGDKIFKPCEQGTKKGKRIST